MSNEKKRILEKLLSIFLIVVGIILFICNIFRIIPENEFLTFFVAYGLLIGPLLFMFGIFILLEED